MSILYFISQIFRVLNLSRYHEILIPNKSLFMPFSQTWAVCVTILLYLSQIKRIKGTDLIL